MADAEKTEGVAREDSSLPDPVAFYKDVLRIQAEARERISAPQPVLTQAEVIDQLRQGVPLLKWDALSWDWSAIQNLFQAVVNAAGEYFKAASRDLESLRHIASDVSSLKEATKAWYEGQPLPPPGWSASISQELLAAVLCSAVKPFLAAHSEALTKLVDQEGWRRGYCPICSGWPDFSFLDKEQGARWLVCSRCDAQWLFQRLQCPYCGTQDQDALAYFTDDEGVYRLYVCERCRSYLKAIDLRRTQSEILLPWERLLTVDMDRQGQEKGYKSGWTGTLFCCRLTP